MGNICNYTPLQYGSKAELDAKFREVYRELCYLRGLTSSFTTTTTTT